MICVGMTRRDRREMDVIVLPAQTQAHADGASQEMRQHANASSVSQIRVGTDLRPKVSTVLVLSAQSAGTASLLMKTAAAPSVRKKFVGTVNCQSKMIHASAQAVLTVSHAGTEVSELTRIVNAQKSQFSAQNYLAQVVNQETLMTALVSLITHAELFLHAERATPSTMILVSAKQPTKSLLMA